MSYLRALTQRSESNSFEIGRGSLINTSGALVGALATFGLLMLVVRAVGLDLGGLFFQSLALISGASILCSLGASMTVTRYIAQIGRGQSSDASGMIWTVLIPVTVFSCVVALSGWVGSSFLAAHLTGASHQRDLRSLIAIMILSVPLIVLTRIFTAISRAVDEPSPGVFYDSGGQPLLRLLATGAVVLIHPTAGLLAWAITLPAVVCCVASAVHSRGSLERAGMHWSLRPTWRRSRARDFWAFGVPRGLEEVVQASSIWLLTLMVGALASPAQAATYAALTRLTMGTSVVLQSFTTAMLPRLAASFFHHERAEVERLFRQTTRWLLVLSIPMCVTLLVFPAALLAVASPDLPGGRIGLQFLAVAAFINVATGPVGGVVLMAGKSGVNLIIAVISLISMLVPAFVLIPSYGASGAAVGWTVSITLQNLLLYKYAKNCLGLSPWHGRAVRSSAASATVSGVPQLVVALIVGDNVLGLVVGLLVGGLGLAGYLGLAMRTARGAEFLHHTS